jgi:hypothetical protein
MSAINIVILRSLISCSGEVPHCVDIIYSLSLRSMPRKFRPIHIARISPDMAFKIDCRTYVGESSCVFVFGVDV